MEGECEAGWECPLAGVFLDVTLRVTPFGSRVIFVHKFCEGKWEVVLYVLSVLLVVEPVVSL